MIDRDTQKMLDEVHARAEVEGVSYGFRTADGDYLVLVARGETAARLHPLAQGAYETFGRRDETLARIVEQLEAGNVNAALVLARTP